MLGGHRGWTLARRPGPGAGTLRGRLLRNAKGNRGGCRGWTGLNDARAWPELALASASKRAGLNPCVFVLDGRQPSDPRPERDGPIEARWVGFAPCQTPTATEGLRERLARQGEDALGKLAQDLLENPLVNGAIARAFEAREKAAQAQEVAMGALNIPSAADLERLTRRVRSLSQRLEGIEDGVDRLDERLASAGNSAALEAIQAKLDAIQGDLDALKASQRS